MRRLRQGLAAGLVLRYQVHVYLYLVLSTKCTPSFHLQQMGRATDLNPASCGRNCALFSIRRGSPVMNGKESRLKKGVDRPVTGFPWEGGGCCIGYVSACIR